MTQSEKKSIYEIIMKEISRNLMISLNESNVIIRHGPDKKTWNRDGYVLELEADPDKYIVLLESDVDGITYEIHIENESKSPLTQDEKDVLFKSLSGFLKKGDVITSFGGCTPGGLKAIENLSRKYGFRKIGTYSEDKLYWSSPRLIDSRKFNEWINKKEHKDMFEVIDDSKPLTINNTRPVISVVMK